MRQEISQLVSNRLESYQMHCYKVDYETLHEMLTECINTWAKRNKYSFDELCDEMNNELWHEFEEILDVFA